MKETGFAVGDLIRNVDLYWFLKGEDLGEDNIPYWREFWTKLSEI